MLDKFINAYEYNLNKIDELLSECKDVVITNRYNSNRWIFFYVENQNNAMALRMIGQPFVMISNVNYEKIFYYFDGTTFIVKKTIDELKELSKNQPSVKDNVDNTSAYDKNPIETLFNC